VASRDSRSVPSKGIRCSSTCCRRWAIVDASRPSASPLAIQLAAAFAKVMLALSAVWVPRCTS
jgi:hypothetical protein